MSAAPRVLNGWCTTPAVGRFLVVVKPAVSKRVVWKVMLAVVRGGDDVSVMQQWETIRRDGRHGVKPLLVTSTRPSG